MSAPETRQGETLGSVLAKASNNPIVAGVLTAVLIFVGQAAMDARDSGPQLAEQIRTAGLLQAAEMRNVVERQTDAVARLGRIETQLSDLPLRVAQLEKRSDANEARAAALDTRLGNQGGSIGQIRQDFGELRAWVQANIKPGPGR